MNWVIDWSLTMRIPAGGIVTFLIAYAATGLLLGPLLVLWWSRLNRRDWLSAGDPAPELTAAGWAKALAWAPLVWPAMVWSTWRDAVLEPNPPYLVPSRVKGVAVWDGQQTVEDAEPVRPSGCCGKCPLTTSGTYDCTCAGNPRCPKAHPRIALGWRWTLGVRLLGRPVGWTWDQYAEWLHTPRS